MRRRLTPPACYFRYPTNEPSYRKLADLDDATVESGPNGERLDVRDHGGYLGGFLTLPLVVVKVTELHTFALRSETFSLSG